MGTWSRWPVIWKLRVVQDACVIYMYCPTASEHVPYIASWLLHGRCHLGASSEQGRYSLVRDAQLVPLLTATG